jgi:DNA-binding CsgD family transcriptional regulator
MTSETNSANAFRDLVHREQQTVLKDLSLSKISDVIFSSGDLQAICDVILQGLRDVLNVQHSVVLVSENAFLSIVATSGKSYPMGARVPKIASLADAFKLGCSFDIHSIQIKQLFMLGDAEPMLAFATPLGVGGQLFGLLAFCLPQPVVKEHIPYLRMAASILSLSIQKNTGRSHKDDHKILMQITPREREVLALLPKGLTNSEIAETLGIAPGTVKVHIEHILSKLELKDRTQAAVKASELGL